MGDHRRFFIEPDQIADGTARITGETAHQIARVLRLRKEETIRLLDGCGNEHQARITDVSGDEVVAEILSSGLCDREPRVHLTLVVCMPKSDKLELIVQKCSELGISRLVVANSERVISRPDASKASAKMARWRKIAAEAAEQCGRGAVAELEGIVEFGELADIVKASPLAMVAWEDDRHTPLKGVLHANAGVESVTLIVGPEGGLTEREVDFLKQAGAVCVTLGKRILRCETAAVAACAAIMYELEGEL